MAICNKVAERLLNGSLFLVARQIAAVRQCCVQYNCVLTDHAGLVAGHRTRVVYPLVLQKVPSELHPKVRNHGEGPY